MNEKYDVVFSCPWAGYYWVLEANLTLQEAEGLALKENKRKQIHSGGCCRYYIQKRE